ncbi:MAG: S41 family peptidase, partial [Bdellovibrionota bacterium]
KEHKQVRGLIIDLRRNPGGLLDQAVRISDFFLEGGTIVSTIGRNKKDKEVITAKKEGTYSGFPIIVLINEYSASASEILAGALQDNKRALIMGQRSFGKGSVQSVVKLGDGSGLKLTVARYYTPSGKSIQSEGIKPDIVIEDVDTDAYKKAIIRREVRRESDMQGHLLGDKEREDKEKSNAAPKSPDDINYWWKQDAGVKKANLTPKEKLLSEDFHVQQAYNYLRASKMMEAYGVSAGPALSEAPAAPQATPSQKK